MSGTIEKINSINQIGNENVAAKQNNTKNIKIAKTTTATIADKNQKIPMEETSLDNAIEKANEALNKNNIKRQFVKDDDVKGRLVVKLIDRETQEVVRQIPSEEAIKISKSIDSMLGMLLDNKI